MQNTDEIQDLIPIHFCTISAGEYLSDEGEDYTLNLHFPKLGIKYFEKLADEFGGTIEQADQKVTFKATLYLTQDSIAVFGEVFSMIDDQGDQDDWVIISQSGQQRPNIFDPSTPAYAQIVNVFQTIADGICSEAGVKG